MNPVCQWTALLPLVGLMLWSASSTLISQNLSVPAIHLTSSLISPTDIELKWKDAESQNLAGHIVEWTLEAGASYVILAFTRPDVASFVHSDLAPETKCYYRIRPYFGPVSTPVEITTGEILPNQKLNLADKTWADPKTTAAGAAGKKFSIRNASTIAQAAPTNLKAILIHPTGILLTWVDHANDEEGFMLEIKKDDASNFNICAIIDPNITSFGYALVPPKTKVSFRIRAFYYGAPSNVAQQTTGLAAFNANKNSH
jgi:hypothetical protein